MVVAVAIAVVIVMASIPVEVEAPFRAPEFPWAPVVQRRWANDTVAATSGLHLSLALTTRAGVAIAQAEPE